VELAEDKEKVRVEAEVDPEFPSISFMQNAEVNAWKPESS
jgi:hypothetical protein